ncbi:M13 family metallopeptidase [Sinomicrobium weinanense]|uniref:M13 family metallopeptidase n=1 Tax=Sinomicrobium weinanense TaxID=2842200 RepID=A0A926Q490_9FLAO|nr:M13 family metallopeptidase [Sinomicrobium weinanense]MBC9796826.1 M13 family metallopeptidase [Sinomicrobium weinanense]MBU3123670.1 M13 family metallopeptidase [Sinomicrobium weinanense]
MKITCTKPVLMGALALGMIVSCKQEKKKEVAEAEVEKVPGINLEYMDTTVAPQEDFFRFVNGRWLDATEIPDDKTSWGSFLELREKTNTDALAILKEAVNDTSLDPGSDQARAANLYQTIMDMESRNAQGIKPLKPYLDKINAIGSPEDLLAYLTEMEPYGGAGFFGISVGADAKDSNKNVVYLNAGRLGLPDRDYYVADDEDSREKREKYKAHIARMLQFIDYDKETAAKEAERILAFETKMASPRLDKVERRNPEKRYNPTAVADLKKTTPGVNWDHYFSALGIKEDTVVIGEVKYFKQLPEFLAKGKLDDWKSYLRWTALNRAADQLSEEIETADWEFYSKTLKGTKEQESRDKRALQTINWTLGEALGKLYVEKKFPPEAKVQAEEMIANVIRAYEARIQALPWMDEETKARAIEKLDKVTIKIAYPDKWKDYSELEIRTAADGGSYMENMLNVSNWNFKEDVEKLGKPVDKTEWYMPPQIVNAYFNPSFNEIVFPAAILQPPFFNFTADAAVNYGGIGAVIGHEISHSFDDQGAKYDADGNLEKWWTDEDFEQFQKLGGNLAEQYSSIEVLPDVFINGKFTLGENIGDLGGVNAAYDGLQMYLKEHGNPGPIDGYSPEQRFFMSWATVWRTKTRDEALKNQIKTDPHSPGQYRATQPLLNIDAFYETFDVKEGDAMYLEPEKRVKIW